MLYDKWFGLAKSYAELFSKDPHVKVGCILLSPHPHVVLSMGYNGCVIPGAEDDFVWKQPMKDHMIVHAETSAVYNAARLGVNLTDSVAVVTLFPCMSCAKALVRSGIRKVVTAKPDYDNPKWGEQFRMSHELLTKTGVDVVFIS